MKVEIVTGQPTADLANAISDALHAAIDGGMAIDTAVCVVAGVAADYARGEYGDAYLNDLAEVVKMHAGLPMPGEVRS